MPKTEKTERELREMISAATGVAATHIKVVTDESDGWIAAVYVAPRDAEYAQKVVDEAARDLRARFDLKK